MKDINSMEHASIPDRMVQTRLTQKAYLNAFAALLDYAARMLVNLLLTPYLVSGLGSTLYGIWQILIRLISYITAIDGRPTQALKWVIANQQQSDDSELKRKAIGSALGIWLLLFPPMAIIGSVLVWIAPTVSNTPPELVSYVRAAAVLLVVNLLLTVLIGVPESVLRGMNLGYKRMGLMAGMNIVGGVLTAAAIYLNWGIVGIAAVQVILTVIMGIIFWYLAKTILPWFGVARVSFQEVWDFGGVSAWYAASNFVNMLLLGSDTIILGWIVSAATVSSYVLTGYAATTLLSIITMVVGATVPGLGGLVGTKQYGKVAETHDELISMSLLVASVLGASILLWNRSFISLWVGAEHYAGTWVSLLLVLIAVQLLFIRAEVFVIDLTLNIRRKVMLGLLAALVSIGLAFPLLSAFGIVGLCIAVLIGRAVLTVSYPLITGKFLRISTFVRVKGFIRPALTMLFLFSVASYAGNVYVMNSWIGLVVGGGIGAAAFLAIQLSVGFTPSQRQRILGRIQVVKLSRLKA
jgi:O-antigen/teichoic acid export membrane protein